METAVGHERSHAPKTAFLVRLYRVDEARDIIAQQCKPRRIVLKRMPQQKQRIPRSSQRILGAQRGFRKHSL